MRKALEDKVKRLHNRASTSYKENEDPLINGNVQIGIGT